MPDFRKLQSNVATGDLRAMFRSIQSLVSGLAAVCNNIGLLSDTSIQPRAQTSPHEPTAEPLHSRHMVGIVSSSPSGT